MQIVNLLMVVLLTPPVNLDDPTTILGSNEIAVEPLTDEFGSGSGSEDEFERRPGDFNHDDRLSSDDIDILSRAVLKGDSSLRFDLNADGEVNEQDRLYWIHSLKRTFVGDSNLDGVFDSSDHIAVQQTGKFGTGQPAGWSEGDWNGDGVADLKDQSYAAKFKNYEKRPNSIPSNLTMGIPEPIGLSLLGLGAVLILMGYTLLRRHLDRPHTA